MRKKMYAKGMPRALAGVLLMVLFFTPNVEAAPCDCLGVSHLDNATFGLEYGSRCAAWNLETCTMLFANATMCCKSFCYVDSTCPSAIVDPSGPVNGTQYISYNATNCTNDDNLRCPWDGLATGATPDWQSTLLYATTNPERRAMYSPTVLQAAAKLALLAPVEHESITGTFGQIVRRLDSDKYTNITVDDDMYLMTFPDEASLGVVTVHPWSDSLFDMTNDYGVTSSIMGVLKVEAYDADGDVVDGPFTLMVNPFGTGRAHVSALRWPSSGAPARDVVAEGGLIVPVTGGSLNRPMFKITTVGMSSIAVLAENVPGTGALTANLYPRPRASTSRVTVSFNHPSVAFAGNELWLTLPAGYMVGHCEEDMPCPSTSTIRLLSTEAFVNHTMKVEGTLVKLTLEGNLTFSGMATIAITNVLLPNNCNDAAYTLQSMYCYMNEWNTKYCYDPTATYTFTHATSASMDGVPQGCTLCNACRTDPFINGAYNCEYDGNVFTIPSGHMTPQCVV